MESKAKTIKTKVRKYIGWYLDTPINELTPDDFKQGDIYWDLVDGNPFQDYDELIKFLQDHANDKIDLEEMQISNLNVIDHVFRLDYNGDTVTFYTQSMDKFK